MNYWRRSNFIKFETVSPILFIEPFRYNGASVTSGLAWVHSSRFIIMCIVGKLRWSNGHVVIQLPVAGISPSASSASNQQRWENHSYCKFLFGNFSDPFFLTLEEEGQNIINAWKLVKVGWAHLLDWKCYRNNYILYKSWFITFCTLYQSETLTNLRKNIHKQVAYKLLVV